MNGSLTGFSLQEVLEVLAFKQKTGLLTVDAQPVGLGRIGFSSGQLYLAEASTIMSDAKHSGKSVPASEGIEEALLEILNWEECVYSFEAGDKVDAGVDGFVDVALVLAAVAKRQAAWEEIREEIPSLSLRDLLALSRKGLIKSCGEVVEAKAPVCVAESGAKALNQKYIGRSLQVDEAAESQVPVEWASYYQMLDARKAAVKGDRVARAVEH